MENRLSSLFEKRVSDFRNRLRDYKFLLERYGPEGRLKDTMQRLVEISDRIVRAIKLSINQNQDYLMRTEENIQRLMDIKLERSKNEVARLSLMLDSVSPLKKLSSGYSFVENATGKNVKSSDDVEVGDSLRIYLSKGKLDVSVTGKS